MLITEPLVHVVDLRLEVRARRVVDETVRHRGSRSCAVERMGAIGRMGRRVGGAAMLSPETNPMRGLPNALSLFRIAMVPVLGALAWNGAAGLFLVALGLAL